MAYIYLAASFESAQRRAGLRLLAAKSPIKRVEPASRKFEIDYTPWTCVRYEWYEDMRGQISVKIRNM